jgi:hypothetical protein
LYFFLFALGSLEILVHVGVLLLAIDGSGWAIAGLIAYYIFCLSNGKTLITTILAPLSLAIIFLYLGFWIAVLAFVIYAILFQRISSLSM